MKTNLYHYLFALIVAAIVSLPATAQTVTGASTGLVTDPSGALVAGAHVTAENKATGVKTAAETNGTGAYTVRFLPIGIYTVTVEAKGFARSEERRVGKECNSWWATYVIKKITQDNCEADFSTPKAST